jgi:hypothetical protein
MGLVSLIIGILVSIGFCVSLIPLVGWLNWINIPIAFIGGVFGFVDMVRYKEPGRGRAAGITGFVLCVLAVLAGIVRLIVGSGVF